MNTKDTPPRGVAEPLDICMTASGKKSIDAAANALSELMAFENLGSREDQVARALSGLRAMQALAASQAASHSAPVRLACLTFEGTTFVVPVEQLGDALRDEDNQHVYTLTFKTMTRAEFDALGDFNGF